MILLDDFLQTFAASFITICPQIGINERNMKKIVLLISLIAVTSVYGHNINYDKMISREWNVEGNSFRGSFLYNKNDSVFFENTNQNVIGFPIYKFKCEDKTYLKRRINEICQLNKQLDSNARFRNQTSTHNYSSIFIVLILLICLVLYTFFIQQKQKLKYSIPMVLVGVSTFILSFTDPYIIQSAFLPFAPNVNTSWDNNYFYVESKGIPTSHTMMVGISNHGWQQQVPIPQCYIGPNAWSIPLNPIMAVNPIPVDQVHFTRGAVGIAVNGVPIFNPYTNTGVDAFLDGQLDSYGGHSGKGDDYHYHTAPLHLYNQTISTLPIAYAFDGFSVFGSLEPDGTAMNTLDANHGHTYNGEYHYHGTTTAPYMIAKFAGEVTEDATHQLIPQAQASPVRTENWTPLNGALITSCAPNGSNNGYNLSYTLNGVSGYATNYSWNGTNYSFNYVTPSGMTTTNYNGFIQCDMPLSISETFDLENLLIYPNPFSDKINLHNENSKGLYILYNSSGQIIYSGKNINEENFSSLPSGVYFMHVYDKNNTYKLVKK